MIETIEYNGVIYPRIQSEGFAAQYAFPFAAKYCKGNGVDIGCMKNEWSYPGALPIDPELNEFDAMNIPLLRVIGNIDMREMSITETGYGIGGKVTYKDEKWDYIFSSHCLEHLSDYVAALDYWHTRLRNNGALFLYLPNMDYQHYWRPQNNRKHLHYITPNIIKSYFHDRVEMWGNVFVTGGWDLNGSFYAIANKI